MSTKERKALGRGFGALLKAVDDQTTPEKPSESLQIPISEIAFNPKQPRQRIDDERLEQLSQSIKTKGVIQPILVRSAEKPGKQYELIAGERRLRACRLAGYDKIPAFVRPVKDDELLEIALIENIQRDNLNPIEESKAYRNLLEEHGYTQENLAQRIGKNRSTIANLIRLLQLPDPIQKLIQEEKLSTGHARALLALESEEAMTQLVEAILKDNLSVRETEQRIRKLKEATTAEPAKTRKPVSPQMRLNQDRLCQAFGTKVVIKDKGDRGRIELEYYSQEDFNRLFSLLVQQNQT